MCRQCMRISAKDVVEDMKLCMSGKWGALAGVPGDAPPRRSRSSNRDNIPPPPQEKAPEPPMHNGYRPDYMHSEYLIKLSQSSSVITLFCSPSQEVLRSLYSILLVIIIISYGYISSWSAIFSS